jgi:hypothetical protein
VNIDNDPHLPRVPPNLLANRGNTAPFAPLAISPGKG